MDKILLIVLSMFLSKDDLSLFQEKDFLPSGNLKEVTVYYLPWSYQPRIPFTIDKTMHMYTSKSHHISDRGSLVEIKENLDNAVLKDGFSPITISVYVHCVLKYQSGRKQELDFGGTTLMKKKGKYYEVSEALLKALKVPLPL